MSNYTESELIPVALKIILDKPNGIATKDLIFELRNLMNPNGEDLEMLSNRNDDKFSQKVRNIKSHKTLENKGYAKFCEDKFFITEKGKNFLDEIKSKELEKKLSINIHEDIQVSVRTSNVLKDQGVIFIDQLIQYTEQQLFTFPGAGKGTIKEIENILDSLGLRINSKNIDKENQNNSIANSEKKLSINILDDWPLSERTYNALKNEEIIYLGDLLSIKFSDLLKLRNFGRKSLKEIENFLSEESLGNIFVDQTKWNKIRDNVVFKEKENKILNIEIQNNLRGIRKTLFKDFEKVKKDFLANDKVKITKNLPNTELEKLILEDINYLLSILSEKMSLIFKARYGYTQNFETLEDLGKKLNVTRERIRQNESDINKTLIKIGRIDRYSLVEFFNKYESISFHKLFPQLDEKFTDTSHSNSGGDITRDRLVVFLENYCGVKEKYFKTPERELWKFDTEKLQDIFAIIQSGISRENFLEIIKENFGYNKFVAIQSIEFMEKKKLIEIKDEKIFPIKMNKSIEVSHILTSYPEGLHWKTIAEIGVKSSTNNLWSLDRLMGDFSLNMLSNPYIYLSERGTLKLFKYNNEIKNKDQIINNFIKYLKENNINEIAMEIAFNEITKKEEFENLNFYDARAIIKRFGGVKGIFHSGKSGTNTISLEKNVKFISLKDKIKYVIDSTENAVEREDLIKKLKKNKETSLFEIHLEDLVNELKIFKISPGKYLNLNQSLKICNKDKIYQTLSNLLKEYNFLSLGFIREKLNDKFNYEFSNFYYWSLIKILSLENNWFFLEDYLYSSNENNLSPREEIKKLYNYDLNSIENYNKISEKIGITMLELMNLRKDISQEYKIN